MKTSRHSFLRDKENTDKYIGSEVNWEKAEASIMEAAKEKGLDTVVEYEAAFYGPKLDFMVRMLWVSGNWVPYR